VAFLAGKGLPSRPEYIDLVYYFIKKTKKVGNSFAELLNFPTFAVLNFDSHG